MTDDDNNNYEQINFIFLGNFFVGKHSIIERFIYNHFFDNDNLD